MERLKSLVQAGFSVLVRPDEISFDFVWKSPEARRQAPGKHTPHSLREALSFITRFTSGSSFFSLSRLCGTGELDLSFVVLLACLQPPFCFLCQHGIHGSAPELPAPFSIFALRREDKTQAKNHLEHSVWLQPLPPSSDRPHGGQEAALVRHGKNSEWVLNKHLEGQKSSLGG